MDTSQPTAPSLAPDHPQAPVWRPFLPPPPPTQGRRHLTQRLLKQCHATRAVICAACEKRRHFECIDCLSNHSTYKCKCECHDENTQPHSIQAHNEVDGADT